MKDFFNNLKIKYKLLIIYSSVFVVILLTSGYIIYSNAKVQIENQITDELTRSIESITNTIDALSKDSIKKELRSITTKNKKIVKYYYNLYKNGEISKEEALKDLEDIMNRQKIGKTGYLAVVYNNKKEKKYVSIIHPHLSKNKEMTNSEVVKKIVSTKDGYFEYIWKNKSDKTFKKKVLYTTYFEPWNYSIVVTAYLDEMSGIINVSQIEQDVKSYKIGKTGFIYIVDSNSNIVYHPSQKDKKVKVSTNEELNYIYKRVINLKNGKIYYDWSNESHLTNEKENKIALFRYIPKLDWYVTASVFLDEFNQPLKKLESAFITSFILLTVFMVMMTFWVSSYITQPLYAVIEKLTHAKQNDFKEKITTKSKDEIGELVGHYNDFIDELEMYSSKLSTTAHKFHAILDNTTAVIYIKDIDGNYELVNKQFEKIFKIEEKNVIGKKDVDIFEKDISNHLRIYDLNVIKNKSSISLEESIKFEDKSLTYISVKFPLFNENNEVKSVCSISTDITNIKDAEQKIVSLNKNLEYEVTKRTSELLLSNVNLETTIDNLEKTQEQLIHSEKMASLGDLVAGVAHEINTPVGLGVTGISHMEFINKNVNELYKNDNLSKDEFEEFLKTSNELASSIHTNLNRAAGLIKSFKQIAVDQSCEIHRTFNLKGYIEETLLSIQHETKRLNHKFIINCDEKLNIKSHPGPISQIITNLIMNSIIHGFKDIDSGIITLDLKMKSDKLVFLYKDNGRGISKENLAKIYNPFFTTNRDHGGSGLGLNIIYNIVVATLKGTIKCNSKEGEGVEFVIKIPVDVVENI